MSETGNQLLDAAEEVFGERGFEASSVREIGKRAGLNTALINYHFGSKAGLYEAVIERRMREAQQIFENAASLVDEASHGPLTREVVHLAIRSVLKSFFLHMTSRPSFVRIMTREVSEGFPVAKHVIQRLMPMGPLQQIIQQAQQAGFVRDDLDAKHITAVLFGVNQHCVSSAPLLRAHTGIDVFEPKTLEKMIDLNLTLIFDGMWTENES